MRDKSILMIHNGTRRERNVLYTGQQYGQEMGQYYLRARFYNPVIGRFTQEDMYRGDGLNLYAYCANNPVNYYDPNGYGGEDNCGGKDKTEDVNNKGTGENNDEPRVPKPGDVDFTGPIPSGSWTLVPEGEGAHLIERSNVRGRSELSIYDQPETPRYYPYGTPESAGQAHISLHKATKNQGIKLRGGNSGMSDQQLLDNYTNAYNNSNLDGIRGDLRTPNSSNVVVTNVIPSEAMNALLEWGEQNK